MQMRLRLCGLVAVLPLALTAGNWSQFRADPAHSGVQPRETQINTGDVGTLTLAWTGLTDSAVYSSPAVVNGIVYVGSFDHKLYAFRAAGSKTCPGVPPQYKTCPPVWTATLA